MDEVKGYVASLARRVASLESQALPPIDPPVVPDEKLDVYEILRLLKDWTQSVIEFEAEAELSSIVNSHTLRKFKLLPPVPANVSSMIGGGL